MLEVRGDWWLPDRPDVTVKGVLTFDQLNGGKLTLIGSLQNLFDFAQRTDSKDGVKYSLTQAGLDAMGNYPRILGLADGKPFTLNNCFQVSTRNMLSGNEVEIIRVGSIIAGAQFGDGEPLEGIGLAVRLKHLAHWTGLSGLLTGLRSGEDNESDVWATIGASQIESDRTSVAGGAILELHQRLGMAGDGILSRSLTQDFLFELSFPRLLSLEDLIDVASDLQDLVSIAVDRTAAFDGLALRHPDAVHETPHGRLIPIDLAILAEWTAIDEIPDKPLNRNDMLFTYLDLGGLPGVARWLEAAAHHRTTLGRVMGTVYAQGMFISDQLLNRAAALEAFDRLDTGMNNSKFKTRLKRCVSLAGPLFEDLVGDVERWAETVRWDRDDVAHHYGRRMKQATLEQRFVADSLYWLYVLCILRKASAPSAVFDGIARQERFRWLAPRIRAAGAPKQI